MRSARNFAQRGGTCVSLYPQQSVHIAAVLGHNVLDIPLDVVHGQENLQQ